MSDLRTEIISGVIGAVTGSLSGAFITWVVAPTQAEREERGHQRLESRKAIAGAIAKLDYEVTEARARLFRIQAIGDLLDQKQFVMFTGTVRSNASPLPFFERRLILHRTKALVGNLVWRLAELIPSDHYSGIDEASLLKATADTRTSLETPLCGTALAVVRPTDRKWDTALKALGKLRKSYPA